jgi:hypothetical protein
MAATHEMHSPRRDSFFSQLKNRSSTNEGSIAILKLKQEGIFDGDLAELAIYSAITRASISLLEYIFQNEGSQAILIRETGLVFQ